METCPFCFESYSSTSTKSEHIHNMHNEQLYACPWIGCSKNKNYFLNLDWMLKHLISEHYNFVCPMSKCVQDKKGVTSSERSVGKHIGNYHSFTENLTATEFLKENFPEMKWPVPWVKPPNLVQIRKEEKENLMQMAAAKKAELVEKAEKAMVHNVIPISGKAIQKPVVLENGKYQCPFCPASYTSLPILTGHKQGKHVDKMFKCLINDCCHIEFAYTRALSHQIRYHWENACMVCISKGDNGLLTESSISDHVKDVHDSDTKSATIAFLGNEIELDQMYRQKKLDDRESKRMKCGFEGCNYTTLSESDYDGHTNRHLDVKPYKCKLKTCDFKSEFKSRAIIHYQIKHGVPTVCGIDKCTYSSTDRGNVTSHQKVCHLKLKPYKCDFLDCPYVAATKGLIRKHFYNNHSLTKIEFPCLESSCDYISYNKVARDSHFNRIHTGKVIVWKKNKEDRVHAFLKANGFDFKSQLIISLNPSRCQGKTRAVLDFLIVAEKCVFVIEVDEFQHDRYLVIDELQRMDSVTNESILLSNLEYIGKPFVWIRYNPDAFQVNKNPRGMQLTQEMRERELLKVLQYYDPQENTNLQIVYMYYSCTVKDNTVIPCIFSDKYYDMDHQKMVTLVIYKDYDPSNPDETMFVETSEQRDTEIDWDQSDEENCLIESSNVGEKRLVPE